MTGKKVEGSTVQGAKSEEFFKGEWEPKTETEFIELLNELAEGMENFGGKWRNHWRENEGKCLRVLRGFREDAKTKIIERPGGYMSDLWDERMR